MTSTALWLSIAASLLELDTTYAFQTLLSRPIIAGPLFGVMIGDAMAGLQIGVFTELLFSDISPLGGVVPPSGVVATVIPMILYSMGVELYFGFFFGVLVSISYSFFDVLLRKARFTWLVFLESRIIKRPVNIKRTIAAALLLAFLMTFIFISITAWISAQTMFYIFPYLTPKIHFAFRLAYAAVPWIGLAALIPSFRLKTR